MQFVLMFNQPTEVLERQEDPVLGPPALEPWKAYMDAMVGAGIMRGGNRLAPPWTATTLRQRGGARQVQDGPFADSKEQLAGFVVIEVPSLDEALAWAERSPSTATGSTEVRPIAPAPE
ncbi:YciI family protein [Roseococcus thiosulfatophilus]|uniref:YciI family protein n=1 Tax=Roseococcus thiosulfatophilus TaxID=35813 RepID=UPI001A8E3EAE|nr:YciI family protein [Roseococcus thiosulfatophilus]